MQQKTAQTPEEVHARLNDWARQAGGNGPHTYLRLYLNPEATKPDGLDVLIDSLKLTHYKQHFDPRADEFMILFNRAYYGDYLARGVEALFRAGDQRATYEVSMKPDLILFTRFWARPQAAVCDRVVLGGLTATNALALERWEASYGGGAGESRIVHEDAGAASLRKYMKLDG
jgi:hypothetical protein